MRSDYFSFLTHGISPHLNILSLDDTIDYIEHFLSLSLLEAESATAFFNRLLNDAGLQSHAKAQQFFLYVVSRLIHAYPLDQNALALMHKIAPHHEYLDQLSILEKISLTHAELAALHQLIASHNTEKIELLRATYSKQLAQNKCHVGAAIALLEIDKATGTKPDVWLATFTPPKKIAHAWHTHVFFHMGRRGFTAGAFAAWEQLPEAKRSAYARTLFASLLALQGNTHEAVQEYKTALAQDPHMHPLKYRIRELENPLVPDATLLHTRKTAICTYSSNKGAMLEQTIRALATCELGNNPLFVLLNGCNDDSTERMQAMRELFPNNPFHVIELPINIGAPAARNWLIQLPEVQRADYVAFLDDDVVMPQDWLTRYVTVAEQNPKIAVVGGKIVFPSQNDELPQLQYMFRTVALAEKGVIRLSMTVPENKATDTGLYSYTRPTMNVMGCLHLLRVSALQDVGGFDLRFSPSQIDDIDHDLCTCLKGYTVMYCGSVTCEHHQGSGVGYARKEHTLPNIGSIIGNDLKLVYKHEENRARLKEIAAMHAMKAMRQ